MTLLRRWLFLWLMLMFSSSRLVAASADDRAYTNAVKSFVDGVWDRAETELAQFVEQYPASSHIGTAVLLQAQAQYCQATNHLARQRLAEARQKFEQAIALLTARQGDADKLADEYLYWRGQAHFQNTNYAAAADAFGKLASSFPTSALRLKASVGEAAAWAKQSDWVRVAGLLQNPDGAFRQAAQAKPDNEFFARGLILLAEAELAQKHYPEAEAALQPIAIIKLPHELDWQRKYLTCRAQLAAGRIEDVQACSAELLSVAEATGRRDLLAESVAFRAGILEQRGQRIEATAMYQRNLTTNTPVEQQRQAILKIGALALAQNQLAEATQTLETFLGRFSNSPAADVALLTLGELHLRQHVSLAETNHAPLATPSTATATNHWQQALTNFDRLIGVYSNSVFVGKAQLGRGWCFWVSNNFPDSIAAFKVATALLPASEDLAVARFKLADGLLAQKDFAGALTNYQGALDAAADLPQVKEALTLPARYQMLRASLGLRDVAGAEDSMRKILQSYPHSFVADRAILLVGQGYADAENPPRARARFKEFIELFPSSPLRPEVELAIAQTSEQEADWPGAIGAYDTWIGQFATNRLRPQAEFYRALANFQAGNETNALTQLTNFVAQFATNDLAPLAQRWVADYYWRRGEFVPAEINYRQLFQTWPSSELAYQARMDAGLAAVARNEYVEAIGYFTNLTGNPNWRIQATFAYGGTLRLRNLSETNNPGSDLKNAIRVFATIYERYPVTEHAALAWGEIGECYFQLGAQDARYYESASNAYQQVLSSRYANAAARSHAKVGLALVAEKQAELKSGAEKIALLKMARDNYLDVFHEKNLRDGEIPDLFWIKEAGLGAARVVESEPFQEWSQAGKFYDRLLYLLPQMKEALEKKRAKVQAHLENKDN